MPTTSVIVAVRNDAEGLRATLDALEGQTVGAPALEVVVVDDASTDGTPEVATGRAGVRLIRLEAREGAYGARNAGIEHSTGEYIAVTDAGCVPTPGWVEKGTSALGADPMTVVAGRIAMPLERRPSLAAMVDVIHHMDQLAYVEQQGSAVTANMLTTRLVFARAGGFDPLLSSSGDREWATRAREAGASLVYCHDAVVVHEPRRRAREVLKKSARVARAGSIARANAARLPPQASRPYTNPYVLVPWNRARGRKRVAENGGEPGRLRWMLVGMAQVALVQLPQAAVALLQDIRLALTKRRP